VIVVSHKEDRAPVHAVGDEDVAIERLVEGVVLADIPDEQAIGELVGRLRAEDLARFARCASTRFDTPAARPLR